MRPVRAGQPDGRAENAGGHPWDSKISQRASLHAYDQHVLHVNIPRPADLKQPEEVVDPLEDKRKQKAGRDEHKQIVIALHDCQTTRGRVLIGKIEDWGRARRRSWRRQSGSSACTRRRSEKRQQFFTGGGGGLDPLNLAGTSSKRKETALVSNRTAAITEFFKRVWVCNRSCDCCTTTLSPSSTRMVPEVRRKRTRPSSHTGRS